MKTKLFPLEKQYFKNVIIKFIIVMRTFSFMRILFYKNIVAEIKEIYSHSYHLTIFDTTLMLEEKKCSLNNSQLTKF